MTTVFELINMRSFSNLWYWIVLAVVWSSAGQRVLGVPWDMVIRARKTEDGEALADFSEMVRINVNRRLRMMHESGDGGYSLEFELAFRNQDGRKSSGSSLRSRVS